MERLQASIWPVLRGAMGVADPQKKVMLAYLLYMLNGQTTLSNLQSDRYPDLRLESFLEFAAHKLPRLAAQTIERLVLDGSIALDEARRRGSLRKSMRGRTSRQRGRPGRVRSAASARGRVRPFCGHH
jgi:hypothetical protein